MSDKLDTVKYLESVEAKVDLELFLGHFRSDLLRFVRLSRELYVLGDQLADALDILHDHRTFFEILRSTGMFSCMHRYIQTEGYDSCGGLGGFEEQIAQIEVSIDEH